MFMATCIYCHKDFDPTSNRQKTCESIDCKKKLRNDRIKRHRWKYKEQNYKMWINGFIANYPASKLDDITKKIKMNDAATTYYHLKKQMKNGRIRRIQGKYILMEPYESKFSFHLDNMEIDIPSHDDFPHYFCSYLEDEGLVLKQNKKGDDFIEYKNLQKAIDICYAGYACVWAQLLSYKMYDQFVIGYPKNVRKREKAIRFFFHRFNSLSIPILTPKNPRHWYGPAFSQIATIYHINNKIKNGDDVSHCLKYNYMIIKKQLKTSHSEYDEIKKILDELIEYSEDRGICYCIYLALKKNIDIHGEPILPIKRIIQ